MRSMTSLIYESINTLAKHYPLLGEHEFELTLNPSDYLRLCHEQQMYSRIPQAASDIGWLNFDTGKVYISVSPEVAEYDALIQVCRHE